MLKLHAWTMVEYDKVLHLDLDSLQIGNIDWIIERPEDIIFTRNEGMSANGRSLQVC